ncbi:phytase, partial [Ideonella sp.]|uniref:phytase n=1 Tax=Ideonella sp. TaxID=1929293 RepID=UPI003BB62098
KDGLVLHLRLAPAAADGSGPWQATELRRWKMASQPEGCVVDEAAGRLFLGEEDRGVWVVDAAADRPAQPRLILPVGGILQADTEGLALWHGREAGQAHSYLVVSSQGNSSYVVLDAAPPWRVRGAFRVGINPSAGIDGSSETDGLEVSSAAFGPDYPEGLLVVQDGHKHLPDGPQNFKLIGWREVAQALGLKP